MSYHQPAEWPLPSPLYYEPIVVPPNSSSQTSPVAEAIKTPGRKVRSDEGTKRGQRKPRSDRAQYIVVAEPELFATEAAAFEAAESHLADPEDYSQYQVFQVRWRGDLEKGVKVTRLGRVRRGKP